MWNQKQTYHLFNSVILDKWLLYLQHFDFTSGAATSPSGSGRCHGDWKEEGITSGQRFRLQLNRTLVLKEGSGLWGAGSLVGGCRCWGEAAALGLHGSSVVTHCPTSVGESNCSHLLLRKPRLQTLNISCSLRPRSHLSLHPHGHFAVFIRQWQVWYPGLRCTGELSQAEGHWP